MPEIVLNLEQKSLDSLQAQADAKGMDIARYLERIAFRMALLEKAGPELYLDLARGLDDIEAGNFAGKEEVRVAFDRFRLK